MPKKRRAKATATAADPRSLYGTTSVPSARASERSRGGRDRPTAAEALPAPARAQDAAAAAAAARRKEERRVAQLASGLRITVVPTDPPRRDWIRTTAARQRCAWARTQHARLGVGSAPFSLSLDLHQMVAARLRPLTGESDSSDSSDSVDSDTDTESDTDHENAGLRARAAARHERVTAQTARQVAARRAERRREAVATQPFPFSGRCLTTYYTSCGIPTETVALGSKVEYCLAQNVSGHRSGRGKKGGGGKAKHGRRGGESSGGGGWGAELQQAARAATQNVDEKLISKLLDHVAEVTGCRRGRLQAKNLLAITTSSPIKPQGGSTGSSSCTAVTMPYRMGQCDAAVLRRYSALQPTAGHRIPTGHGHGRTDRSPLQAEEIHLLLFAPPVSGRK
jgi:hypothetical protein